MAFWHRKKNWEDEYDEYYAQDRRAEPGKEPGRLRYIPHLLLLGFCGALFVGAAGVISGPTMVEKLLTGFVSPVGILWLGLITMVYFCLLLRQAWPALIGFFCWMVLTLGGNAWVAGMLARSLEAPYQDINVLELEPLDVVVVLGGGTNTRLNGNPQAAASGDRVMVAARLFHEGITDQLICTGSQKFMANPDDLHPREEAFELLVSLGVPEKSVLKMRGNNTSEEIQNLKTWLAEKENVKTQSADPDATSEPPKPLRVGIVTSAWHMTRALRLAKTNGLEVVPVPADFFSEPFVPTPNWVIPGGNNLDITAIMIKEYLARIVGR